MSDAPLRLHVQNPGGEVHPITQAQLAAALARHPDVPAQASLSGEEAGLEAALPEAEVLLTFPRVAARRFPEGALPGAAPRLSVLAFTSAGLDRLAPFDWLPPGVALLNNRGTHAEKAGEYGIMALLMLRNHLPRFVDDRAAGRWAPVLAPCLAGSTLLLLGLGSLGGGVARRARGFGVRVLGVRREAAPHPDCDEVHAEAALDDLLPRADVLFLACPLTERTRGLVSRERLRRLPRGAGVVNVARGAIWDQEAVLDLLEEGHLSGAVVDVTDPEPPPPGHRVWTAPRLILTPHMSCDDPTTYNERTLDILFENLRARRAGRPMPNRVDPALGY